MPKSFEVHVDTSKARRGARQGAVRGLQLATEHLLQVSRTRVPIEEGTLERSGTASVDPSSLRGAVSYDTPYAVKQHEDLTLNHDAGRTAKYLEQAFTSEKRVVAELIAREVRRELHD